MKHMKFIKWVFLVPCLLLSASVGFAGQEGKGAGGFYCPNNPNKLPPYILLDLWESELAGVSVQRTDRPVGEQIEFAFSEMVRKGWNPDFIRNVRAALEQAYNIVQPVRNSTSTMKVNAQLKFPTDANSTKTDAQCEKEFGIALWTDLKNILEIDRKLIAPPKKLGPTWFFEEQETREALLPHTDQACTWIHEAIYKVMRTTNRNLHDSTMAREFTRQVCFAQPSNAPGGKNIWPAKPKDDSNYDPTDLAWDGLNSRISVEIDPGTCGSLTASYSTTIGSLMSQSKLIPMNSKEKIHLGGYTSTESAQVSFQMGGGIFNNQKMSETTCAAKLRVYNDDGDLVSEKDFYMHRFERLRSFVVSFTVQVIN